MEFEESLKVRDAFEITLRVWEFESSSRKDQYSIFSEKGWNNGNHTVGSGPWGKHEANMRQVQTQNWDPNTDLWTKGEQIDLWCLKLSQRLLVEGMKLEKAVTDYFMIWLSEANVTATANWASAAAAAKRSCPEMSGSPPSLTPPKEKCGQSGTMETIQSKLGVIRTGLMTGSLIPKFPHRVIPTVMSLVAWHKQSPPMASHQSVPLNPCAKGCNCAKGCKYARKCATDFNDFNSSGWVGESEGAVLSLFEGRSGWEGTQIHRGPDACD